MHELLLPIDIGSQSVNTHVVTWGDESLPALICVHGLTRNCRDFDELALALSQDFFVITIDIAGRGKSDYLNTGADYSYTSYYLQVQGVLDHFKLLSYYWLGTSMGGILGMMFAAQRPEKLKALVISDVGFSIPLSAIRKIETYLAQRLSFSDFGECVNYLKLIHQEFGELTEKQWSHLALHSYKKEHDLWHPRFDPAILDAFSSIDRDLDLSPIWEKVDCPTLLLRGADSKLFPRNQATEMSRKPKVTLREFADIGHAPMMMNLEQIQAVQTFLNLNLASN